MRARAAGLALAAVLAAGLAAPAAAQDVPQGVNDYPTEARVEYVMTCMATNGETPTALQRCSCAIDNIAAVLAYDDYVGAETVLRMRQTSGERSGMFRQGAMMNDLVSTLRRAEAEAEILCF